MTKEELKEKYDKAFISCITSAGWSSIDDHLYGVYSVMWGKTPHKIYMYDYVSYMKERCGSVSTMNKCLHSEEKEDEKYDNIIIENSFRKMVENLNAENIAYEMIRYESYPILITESGTIVFVCGSMIVLNNEDVLPKWCEDGLVFAEDDSSSYEYLIYDKDGFTTMPLQIKRNEVDIEMNYNDDLPDETIREFLYSEDSGLIILHGKPGCGKSHYIRELITTVDRDFLYMDQSAFDNITDATFIRTLSDYENAVLILEDCESMLVGRLEGNNKLSALLNLTDGLLGDSFKFKIICTFNSNIGKIDAALLRKGRLKVKYEFKELSVEKVQALAEKLGKKRPMKKMMLTDVYNDENDIVTSEEKSMGFL